MQRNFLAGGLLAAALTLAACGGITNDTTDVADGPAAGTCLEGTPDCDDTGILDSDDTEEAQVAGMCAQDMTDCDDTGILDGPDEPVGDVFDNRTAITHAKALLGLSEAELDLNNRVDVRIGRRGEEQMALTEDYHLGRMTVQLDINDMDEWIVTAVTVELIDAPETFTRHLT